MERNFTDENFERFLRQSADGLRMRPSDKVWSSISRTLNRRRRRLGWLLGVSLLFTTSLGYLLTANSSQQQNIAGASPTHNPGSRPVSPSTSMDLITSEHLAFSSPATKSQLNASRKAKTNVKAIEVGTSPIESATSSGTEETIPFDGPVIDSHLGMDVMEHPTESPVVNEPGHLPLTIESVTNSYIGHKRNGRLGLQIYFTPTVSYRKLNDNHIDNLVTHKPDFGFELGLAAKYKVAKKVKLRAGIQFNVNRYDIKTYNTTTQLATIRLNSRTRIDTFNTATNYNNFGGYSSDWLHNYYFQISAPIGLEVKLRGDERMQFGLASTIQPTYVLGDRAYLISSDYKNYAEVPRLIRRWNLNTSIEPYVAYSTGQLKWQVGPQVRYQLLSSYVKKYPVKENLFDFGLKVGISLNNQ